MRQQPRPEVGHQQKLVPLHVREIRRPENDVGTLDDELVVEPTTDHAIAVGRVVRHVERVEPKLSLNAVPIAVFEEAVLRIVEFAIISPSKAALREPVGNALVTTFLNY